ncbi:MULTISPECIES: arsenosugar biosynthesis radical SAM (seleno)protein ArsS [Aerococcus]|uniref:Radical SAM/Cys-rich domain protein n=2 Tax=Aerococcus TaxID=1375 RepID=A0A5N1GJX9_9LACT|nr:MULTISPECIES: arsenosugar biosynthesis radical SAM (seleno)protein ArsS [Aerococcus]KAA9301297.1 radical SAM/Cys-rich domain protein [Aerococcus sanguinicola]MDK6370066.1 arsenosugar biosynthesis radical SAM protein ArsS [Aerococcus sp. UMB9870]MDK6680668.1 arsenosugar biosynthesis radical SAM protein ArsS [Aerococcus sp. UMB8608]MDK6687465.1 arsenosugar biosynthesis radical SAM protein ArsS [Aerococcus sp. UMB8623]MDK6940618.1 arsenosugar biosynthesis radical SAM protein ArsS [Aerococcus s
MTTDFIDRIEPEYRRTSEITTLQVNIGKVCNLRCRHCHVMRDSKNEMMSPEIMDACIEFLKAHDEIKTLDITGGEPTMHPGFTYLAEKGAPYVDEVIVRTNGTFLNKRMRAFYQKYPVTIFISMPCYTEDNVDIVRGSGVFKKLTKVLQELNSYGYGIDKDRPLNLVHNPLGATLPPGQNALAVDYRNHLGQYGIEFTNLYTITNLPMGYFEDFLNDMDYYDEYMDILRNAFNPVTVPNLMCRSQLSVGYDGQLYDCDFHQMANLPISTGDTITDVIDKDDLGREILFRDYCYGCTAGFGSSCGGELTTECPAQVALAEA